MSYNILLFFLIATFAIMLTFRFLPEDLQTKYGIFVLPILLLALIISFIFFEIKKALSPNKFEGLSKEEYEKKTKSNGPLGKYEVFLDKKAMLTKTSNIIQKKPKKLKFKDLSVKRKVVFVIILLTLLSTLISGLWEIIKNTPVIPPDNEVYKDIFGVKKEEDGAWRIQNL